MNEAEVEMAAIAAEAFPDAQAAGGRIVGGRDVLGATEVGALARAILRRDHGGHVAIEDAAVAALAERSGGVRREAAVLTGLAIFAAGLEDADCILVRHVESAARLRQAADDALAEAADLDPDETVAAQGAPLEQRAARPLDAYDLFRQGLEPGPEQTARMPGLRPVAPRRAQSRAAERCSARSAARAERPTGVKVRDPEPPAVRRRPAAGRRPLANLLTCAAAAAAVAAAAMALPPGPAPVEKRVARTAPAPAPAAEPVEAPAALPEERLASLLPLDAAPPSWLSPPAGLPVGAAYRIVITYPGHDAAMARQARSVAAALAGDGLPVGQPRVRTSSAQGVLYYFDADADDARAVARELGADAKQGPQGALPGAAAPGVIEIALPLAS